MYRKIISLLLALIMVMGTFSTAYAAVENEGEIATAIEQVRSDYQPGSSYFVSNSTQKWVGEDNIDGDKTKGCFAPGTTNSHGRFGGLWQSMGFANYVFYNVFGDMPGFGYHCNPSELNDKVEVIGRYASKCRYIRGTTDGDITVENIKNLLSGAKPGDIIVTAPKKKCNLTGSAMVVTAVEDEYVRVYHADFKDDCAVTEDILTYDALADYHCLTLLRSVAYPYPEPVAPQAVDGVKLSGDDFSLSESVSASWQLVSGAEKYEVSLMDESGATVAYSEVGGSVASFVFENAGLYKISVVAANQYGKSEPVFSDNIRVHNRNVVTFLDHDGTVITEQKVEYGGDAVAPNVPQRKGYQFAGWDKSLKSITAPTTITATYEVEKYTIKYCDVGGKTVLSAETVEYHGKANPPENYTISDGYVFAGWQISFDSEGSDYNCVDGDMTLIATQKWADENLPITITVNNAYRDTTATYYNADIVVKNNDTATRNFKIIGTLKASDGKALKIVVLDELSLSASESKTLSGKNIVYSEKASTIEFVAVGMVGNSKTGGAFSKTVSATILDNSCWGSWSDWTTENMVSSYDDYETKTQYRYRNKVYTTATSSSLSGWEKYNTTSSTGSWSNWSTSYVSEFTNDAQKREVKKQYVDPIYKTQYHYYHRCKTGGLYTHSGTFHEIWVDQTLPYQKTAGGMDWYKGPACSGPYGNGSYAKTSWFICDGTTYGGPGPWTRPVQIGGGYYQYSYRDTYYTYHFWKWGDWSSWSDTYKAGDGTETRTLYRYRNRSVSGDVEDTSGEFFKVEGTIENVDADFSGMLASIMVYKKCNTDPTEEQLEYVGETTIGAGNTYSFEFKPREMPSGETGEFIVALGIEGADRLVNIDVIEADAPVYQVKFIADGVMIEDANAEDITDSDGNTYRAQLVREGECAIAPIPPEKEGHTFVKWSETLTGIKTNKIISAQYEPNEYTLVFIDWDENTVTTSKMKYGETIVYPSLPAVEGVSSRTWDKQLEGVEIVTDNMIIGSVSTLRDYTVTFMNGEETILTETVKHGHKATLPEQIPTAEGMKFAGWVGECSHEYITADVIFTPFYLYEKTVPVPEATVTGVSDDGSTTVALSCDTQGAKIYYIIKSHDAELMDEDEISLMEAIENESSESGFLAKATEYTGEITLAENESITFVAYADGMNESIPTVESNVPEHSLYDLAISENSLRRYRSSVEGSIKVNISNARPEYEHGTVSLCFYDHRGVMIDVIPMSTEIVPGDNVVEFKDIELLGDIVENADSISCRVVAWLEGEEITPISDYVQIDIK